jgi:hypothetical protein
MIEYRKAISSKPEKSELYKIIRERPNDEKSRILELRQVNKDDPINMEMEFPDFT